MVEQVITNEIQRTYSVLLDIDDYRKLHELRGTISEEKYRSRRNAQNNLTRLNLQTSLGERFNAECMQVEYQIENGQLIHPAYQIPFIKVIKKGQSFREANGSTKIPRELAELTGFEKVQSIVTSPDFDSQAKVIVISPRGGQNTIYGYNFYDVYSKEGNGHIMMSRFYSKSSYG